MFTGIVEEVGRVLAVEPRGAGSSIVLHAPRLAALAALGDSIAVSGCCLTVVAVEGEALRFEAIPETLSRSTLGALRAGSAVNLEDALRAGEPFGGHLVQGHVDAVGSVESIQVSGDDRRIVIEAPAELRRYIVEKGSITVEGVSLTVASITSAGFSVALIPHTWEATTLSSLSPGAAVNLEADVVAKHVERLLRPLVS